MDFDTLLNIVKRNNKKINNNEFQNKIVDLDEDLNENTNIEKDNNAIIHLRLGDILDDPFYGNNKFKIDRKLYENIPSDDEKYPKMIKMEYNNKIVSRAENPNHYLKSISYYINVINKLKDHSVDNVIIIAGSHINCKNYKLSSYVFNVIRKLFEINDINVKISIGKHPDSDLFLVVNSEYFVPSNGGYSHLLTDIAKFNNVKII